MPNKNTISIQFNFYDWLNAFDFYEDNLMVTPLVMIISTHEFTSGYWIESDIGQESTPHDIVYRGKEVAKLKTRVQTEISTAKAQSRGIKFTI